jgi:hypothetical protein
MLIFQVGRYSQIYIVGVTSHLIQLGYQPLLIWKYPQKKYRCARCPVCAIVSLHRWPLINLKRRRDETISWSDVVAYSEERWLKRNTKVLLSNLPILLVISFHRPILIAVRTVELNMLSYLSTTFSLLIGLMSMRISERGVPPVHW